LSLGPGKNGMSGRGSGHGIGPGEGDGLGLGRGGNTGGDIYRPGNGVSQPRLLREVKPQYTSDAMRAKVQGTVVVVCVVRADGTITDVRVARPLDPTFGLDQQALAAVRQWKFAPGTRLGEPVAVQITVELTFTLR
jgi:periplasmic protein TonB